MKKMIFPALVILAIIACNSHEANRNKNQEAVTAAYVKQGDSIVKITFDTLRNTLLKTISEKGLPGAIQFCNVQALPLTSLYASGEITISRVSDRTRNPGNALTATDSMQWAKYLVSAARKDSLQPAVITRNNEVHFYKPIITQPMCLGCHGTVAQELSADLLPVIDSLYPADKARNYRAGELRGMWHIVFNKQPARGQ